MCFGNECYEVYWVQKPQTMEPSARPDIFNNEETKEAYKIIVGDDMKKQRNKLIFF